MKLNGSISSERAIKSGVPQGSILGPLLFIMFMNDFPDSIKESKCIIYADDTTLYVASRIPSNIEFALNSDLVNASSWYSRNRLKLNIAKTQFMVIHPTRMRDEFANMNVFIQGQHVKRETAIKILGINISEDLKWNKHVKSMLQSLRYQYRAFSRSVKHFDRDTRILVYNSTIASRMNYGDSVWSQCNVKEKRLLQSVQNMAVRRIANAGPLDSARPIIATLGLLPLEEKRLLRSLVLFYKLANSEGPRTLTTTLDNNFSYPNQNRLQTRNREDGKYFIPRFNTNYVKKSFFVQMIKEWNRLPQEIRHAENSTIFKNRLYKRMLESFVNTCH